jgi:hypothetical protein
MINKIKVMLENHTITVYYYIHQQLQKIEETFIRI